MSDKGLQTVLQRARRMATVQDAGALTDHALLERFIANRDEAAFQALVQRQAAMVLGVCRRVLKHGQDAEDASQATFLVLARSARSIRKRTAVASWLYGVAYRIASRLRRSRQRRMAREARAAQALPGSPAREASWREVLEALDEALMALPETHRAPLVLCYLQEQTRDDAAAQLGLPVSTLRGRLERSRRVLRTQLARRGITLSGALLAAALAESASGAGVAPAFVVATVAAALGRSAGAGATQASLLADGAMKSMLSARSVVASLLLAMLGLGAAAALAKRADRADDPPPPAAKSDDSPAHAERRDLYGDPLPQDAIARLGTVRLRPGDGNVDSIEFTSDGKQMVANVRFGAITVWDVESGKELCRYTPDRLNRVEAALLTPDGRSVVTVERVRLDAVIRIRNRVDLKLVRELPPINGFLQSPRLTPDGKHLLLLGLEGAQFAVQVWDLEAGKRVLSWASAGFDSYLDISRDGKAVATNRGNNDSIRVWDVQSGKLIRELGGFRTKVNRFAMSPDGKLLATLTVGIAKAGAGKAYLYDDYIRIWDVASGKEIRQLNMDAKVSGRGYRPGHWNMTFAPDGKHVVTAGEDGLVRVWETATGKELRQFPIGRAHVTNLTFTPDGKTLAVGGDAVRLFDWQEGKNKLSQFGHAFTIGAIAVSPDGRTVATAAEGPVQVWDAATGRPLRQLDGHDSGVARMQWSADGQQLLIAGHDNTVGVWDVRSGAQRRHLTIPGDTPNVGQFGALAITHDGATAAMPRKDGSIGLLDLTTGKERGRPASGAAKALSAAFTPDGGTLVVWHIDHTAHVWDTVTGKEVRQFLMARTPTKTKMGGSLQFHPYACAVSPDGQWVVYGSKDKYLAVYAIATGELMRVVQLQQAGTSPRTSPRLVFTPDGRSLAWFGQGQQPIDILEVATGGQRLRLDGHKGGVTALAFSADGRNAVSGGDDTTALVWDLAGMRSAQPPLDRDAAWGELASDDATAAYRAMRQLVAAPKVAVALVREHVKPVAAPDSKHVAKWIADLDSEQFAVRTAAERELEKLGDTAVSACQAALKNAGAVELRRRLEGLVAKHMRVHWQPDPDRRRILRLIEVLELAGTSECRAALQQLANGAAGAQLTDEAQASLRRLAKR
jgi:RNA polymerase sigma factor (sigma-70 family)